MTNDKSPITTGQHHTHQLQPARSVQAGISNNRSRDGGISFTLGDAQGYQYSALTALGFRTTRITR